MYGGNDKRMAEIAAEVKRTVIGQDAAVDWLCTFVDAACMRAFLIKERGADAATLPNVGSAMIVGPTASGKSHLLKTFARSAGLLYHPIDGGQMTGEGWRGNSFSEQWAQISDALEENPGRSVLVFVDEVDKMFAKRNSDGTVTGTAVFDLLKPLDGGMLEGMTDGNRERRYALDCDRCVFVLAGAFTGIEELVAQRIGASRNGAHQVGFSMAEPRSAAPTEDELRAQVSFDDLEAWGVPREIIGRLSAIRFLAPLGEEALRRIVHEVKQAEYGHMFPGATFTIDKAAEDVLVARALAAHYGARLINQQLTALVFGEVWRAASELEGVSSVLVTARDGELGFRLEEGGNANVLTRGAGEQERLAAKAAYSMLRAVRTVLSESGAAPQIDPTVELGQDCAAYAAALLCRAGKVSWSQGRLRITGAYAPSEITLLYALYALLKDWFPASDATPGGMRTLLAMADPDKPEQSPLDLLFYQIESGLRYQYDPDRTRGDDGNASRNGWVWVTSNLVRREDGVRPGDVGGLAPSEDRALGYYTEFKDYPHAAQADAIRSLSFRLL